MKNLFRRVLPLMLAFAMVLATPVFAEDTVVTDTATENTITIKGGLAGTVTANFVDGTDAEKMSVTYTGGGLVAGKPYLVLALSGGNTTTPTESNIQYIGQETAVADEETGVVSVTFEVYPKVFAYGTILITGEREDGETGPLVAAIYKAAVIIGDIDGDGAITIMDAVAVVLYVIGSDSNFTEHQLAAADTDGNPGLTILDAVTIVRVALKLETFD